MDGVLRAFDAWLNGGGADGLLWWSLALLVLGPALIAVHELGHAAVALLRTEGLVHAHVGREPGRLRGRIGRLVLTFDFAPGDKRGGFAQAYAALSRRERIAFVLAGPAAEAVAAGLLVALGVRLSLLPLVVVGGLGIVRAAYNLYPSARQGRLSDGAHVRAAIRARAIHRTELDDRLARAHVLFATPAKHLTGLRTQLLGGAPVAAGHAPDDRSHAAVGLFRLAYAGWCFSEAGPGDCDELRGAALDALHDATMTGAVEPRLTALAVRALAGRDVLQRAFPEVAFAQVCSAHGPLEQERFAFRYGLALREIERVRE
jgi:hypothetical protein